MSDSCAMAQKIGNIEITKAVRALVDILEK
jgi:hypothetical protein